jgi:hypothetical protein
MDQVTELPVLLVDDEPQLLHSASIMVPFIVGVRGRDEPQESILQPRSSSAASEAGDER